jgi:hypothetical protein
MTMQDPKSKTANPRPKDAIARKKRRRTASAAAQPAPKRPVSAEPPASSWTTGHVAMALIAGLSAGAVGGYYLRGGSESPVGKDAAASTAAAANAARPGVTGRPAEPDPGPVYIPLASWSPRKGPEHAKVTILEFSDFQ